MGFLDLFVAALMPVLKTLIVTAIGLLLAIERVNLLGPVARHHLNNLVFYVFTPALVASNLADTVTSSSILSLWFMPVNILLTFIIGSALGWILVKITRTPKHLHGLVIGCCSAGNLGNLLLIIIPAVCDETNSPFGDSSTCTTNGDAYASLSMAIGAVYIWIYVYNIIRASASKRNEESIDVIDSIAPGEITDSWTEPLVTKGSRRSEDFEAAESPRTGSEDKVPFFKKIQQHMKNFSEKINLKMLLAPSTIATIVGLLVGVITPIRKLIIGDDAPLRVLESSATLVGEATIPSMTLIVGANLLKGLKRSGIGLWVIIGVNVVRYIAMPLCGILVVKGARHFGLVGSDALYQFVLLLQYALPSAMTIGTITQLFEVGESECSVIMLWNYAVASLFLTLWTAYYMWLVS
ncbi:protein PIN-LIKES 3-like [Rhododendron vialii]|uniref:protein PIN-LIKES 3-like n=1 Tax=Rhododendron vialii TaxID=182163 RepID=UPI00265F5B7C|nr:protein PIN-LIKES 3-like [Rhododendron vialii]XP_058187402.1 protein PIN-LIKES 3-like [Rhododendron vialii]XP_058187403.1 protein PIN-LIKES 3-like [Rhododendron vialii]XP_058187404.1 protein PIN-LIKES 3-like [Rhododendron vialii]XP_058187405.1 protein PIN-LIKES 3-like [Rhododendron vialii]XP_058187406.1 protein PIN-LIKES 3-like [Rhododendron vialii]XP_058187407.1 protein PIN-LIKES 3-like [Rhododendron vialii]XP_058187408.1 protein PIN-LIKES 3-like [Rhododendron vialii]XP_058187409.1 prot